MRTALVLGGGDTLHHDIARARASVGFSGVVACNDAGRDWPGDLDAWVTLHPDYWVMKRWFLDRDAAGLPRAKRHFAHARRPTMPEVDVEYTHFAFTPDGASGSSGLFAAKVALVNLGFDRAVLCGIPMTWTPHYWGGDDWKRTSVESFRRKWLAVPEEYRARMRSLSGWTRTLLGAPEEEREPAP